MNPELSGVLSVVALPIGNADDLSPRAGAVLRAAGLIAAEDTRRARPLLAAIGAGARLVSYHEHNEEAASRSVLEALRAGTDVALISDAGTPLVSDPGFRIVQAAHREGVRVVPVPGACAAVVALSASGLGGAGFAFDGFPPRKAAARRAWFSERVAEPRTLIFYESAHRIVASVRDMAEVLGAGREATLARELTKTYETVRHGTLGSLLDYLNEDENHTRGEFVVLVAPAPQAGTDQASADRLLRALAGELPATAAARVAARVTGLSRQDLYRRALELGDKTD